MKQCAACIYILIFQNALCIAFFIHVEVRAPRAIFNDATATAEVKIFKKEKSFSGCQ